jgi:hypothetical protein
MNATQWILVLLAPGCDQKTWHGPNLKQSLKGISVEQASWRPGRAVTTSGNVPYMPRIGNTWCAGNLQGQCASFALKAVTAHRASTGVRRETAETRAASCRASKIAVRLRH